MQRRDSLGETSKIPRLSTGSTRRFKSRRSQSSIGSITDVFACEASSEGHSDLSVNGMKLRSEKNLDGDEGWDAEAGAANVTPTDPFEEGEQTLIRTDHHHREDLEEPSEDFEREEIEKAQETAEHSEVRAREEIFFKEASKSETKNNSRRKIQSSLVKQGKDAMMSSISPREEQPSSKAKRSFKTMYDERLASLRADGLSSGYDYPGLVHSDMDFTPSPRQEKSKNTLPEWPARPMSDGITMGASSTFDRLMMSMGTQKAGASSSTRLQPQLISSSLGLFPVLGAAGDLSDMFAGVMTALEELRHDSTERIDKVQERAHHGHERLRDEMSDVRSQARSYQVQLIRNTDQCLAESLALATKESQERSVKMTRDIERLLNDHDNTYAHKMTSLEKRLDAKADLMMRKLDEILNGSNGENRPAPTEASRQATGGSGTHSCAGAQPRSKTNFEPYHGRETGQPRRGWVGRIRLRQKWMPHRGHVYRQCHKSVNVDLTTVSQETTMYASIIEPLNRSLETFITKLLKSNERGERSRRTLKNPKSYKDESDGCIDI